MTSKSTRRLGRVNTVGPATAITDALVFAAAPDTQALSEPANKDRKPILVDGGRKLYEGEDYALVRNNLKEVVAITSLVGGYLDAGGNADCDFIAAYFNVDDTSEVHLAVGEATRVVVDATSGGPCDFEVIGSDGLGGFYSLTGSIPIAVAATQTRTVYVDEGTSKIAVVLTGVTGPIQVRIQDES